MAEQFGFLVVIIFGSMEDQRISHYRNYDGDEPRDTYVHLYPPKANFILTFSPIAAGANATGPVTAVYQGTTFTSGYAYLSFDSAFARDDCLKEFGNMYTNTYVAVPSSLLSSFRGVDGNAPYSFNFADLNYPVPYSAYNGMNVCEPECSYIQDGAYHPQLSLPPQVKDLDPAWKNCNMAFWGAWDPPIALTPAAVAAVPTPVFGPISGKPEPASTPVTVAKPTSSPNQGVPAHYPQRPSAAQPQASPSKAAAPVAPTPQAPAAHPIISIIQSGAAAQPLPPSDPAPVPPAAPAEAGPLQGLNSAVASVANGAGSPPSYSDPKAASPPQAPAAQEIPPTGPVAEAQQPSNAGSQQPPNAGSQQPPNAGSQQPPNAGSQGAPAPNEAPNEAPVAASAIPAVQLTPVSPADPSTPAAVVIGGSTIREGDPAATIAGTPVSVANGGVIIGPSTVALPQPGSPEVATNGAAPIASVGGQPISVVPDPASDGQAKGKAGPGQNAVPPVVIGGQAYSAPPPGQPLAIGSVTLQPGGAPATISGQVVSLGSSNLVVGKSTAALMPPDVAASPAATFAVGNSEVVASTGQPLIVGGSTLSAGGSPATVSGHVISVAPSGVAIDGSVVPFTTGGSAANQNSAVFSVNGQTYSAARGAPVMVGSSTLSVGGPAATVSGHVISVAPSGVMVDNVLASYGNAAPSQKSSDGAIFTLDNGLYSASSGQALTIGSATLTAGAPAQTISDHVVSLGSAGVVVDGNTVPYSEIPASGSPPDFTLNGGVYTAPLPGQPLVVGSMTLTSGGPAATLSNGEVVSVGSAGVIIGSSTVPFYTGPGSGASPSTFSVDGHVYTAPASGQSLVIGDETVSLGGPAATLPDGEVVSIGSKGVILGGSSTVPFNTAGRGAPSSETFTIDGHVYTAPSPGQALTIGSITLRSGGPAGTFADGHTVSIGANGVIVGGTSTVPFFTTAANPFAPTFTADGHVYTAPRSGRPLTMGSITLSPGGPAATLSDGEIVSLGPNGVVVDGKTTVPYARSRSTARPGDRVVSAAPTVTDAVSSGPGNSLSTTSGSAQETSSTAAGSGKPRLELETTLVFVLACIAAVLFTRAS
ncbi:MAG: hypothetical protein Q9157_002437 [Trypethelium eluteriae]